MAKFKGTDNPEVYTLGTKRDVVSMSGGNDAVYLSAATFGERDRINGGAGEADGAFVQGGGFYNFGHGRLTHFEALVLDSVGEYEIYIDDTVVAAKHALVVSTDAKTFFDGAAERDGYLIFHASGADDILIGGGSDDMFYAGQGDDLLTGNEGRDTFDFAATYLFPADWGNDRITDFHPGEDHLVLHTATVTSFDDLLLEKTRDGLIVRTPDSDSSILLYGLLPRDLHADDVTIMPRQVEPHGPHALAIPHDGPLA